MSVIWLRIDGQYFVAHCVMKPPCDQAPTAIFWLVMDEM